MKNNHIILIGFGFFTVGLPAVAVERPAEAGETPPPPVCVVPEALKVLPGSGSQVSPDTGISGPEKRRHRMLLGIQPGEVDPALKTQLGLDGFAGIVVEDVLADSPAGKAGIQQYDIITKVAGKPISHPRDIKEALLNSKEGDKIEVELLRSCEQHTVELVLDQALKMPNDRVSQSIPPAKNHIDQIIGAGQRSLPMDMSGNEDVEDLYKMLMEQMMPQRGAGRGAVPQRLRDRIERLRRMTAQMEEQMGKSAAMGGNISFRKVSSTSSGGITTVKMRDNKGVIEISSAANQGTRLVVRDEKGNVIFDGPYSTDQDREKVPDNIKERLKGICINE